ncbi:MAG: hypothetical protein V3U37_07085 [Nitrospinaceae bacterium]
MKYKDLNVGDFFSYLSSSGEGNGMKRPDAIMAMKTHEFKMTRIPGLSYFNAIGVDGEIYQMDRQDFVKREYPHFED